MTPHEQIFAAIGELVEGRVFAGIADEGTATPYVTFYIVGGSLLDFISGDRPAKRFVRVQVNTWAGTSIEAFQVAGQVEDALHAAVHLQTETLDVARDDHDEVTKDYGAMQEFMLFC